MDDMQKKDSSPSFFTLDKGIWVMYLFIGYGHLPLRGYLIEYDSNEK